jgi:DNA invertase Pin-like site-specific DNA recombinase
MIPANLSCLYLKGEPVSAPAVNGHGPDVETDPLDAEIERLEAMIEPLRAKRADLEVQLLEVRNREERIANAINALGGQAPRPSAPAVAKRRPPGTAPKGKNNWVPSEEVIAHVHAALKAATEPMTVSSLAERVDVSRDTVNRAINYLRDEDKARLVGRSGQGNARLYLAMET